MSFRDKFCLTAQQFVNIVEGTSNRLVDINGDVNHEQQLRKTHNTERGSSSTMDRSTESTVGSNNAIEEIYKCYCGRIFTTYRSLNLHRRLCFIQDSAVFGELFVQQGTNVTLSSENLTEALSPPSDKFKLLPGVRLPRSDIAWKAANDYFQSQFSHSISNEQ